MCTARQAFALVDDVDGQRARFYYSTVSCALDVRLLPSPRHRLAALTLTVYST